MKIKTISTAILAGVMLVMGPVAMADRDRDDYGSDRYYSESRDYNESREYRDDDSDRYYSESREYREHRDDGDDRNREYDRDDRFNDNYRRAL